MKNTGKENRKFRSLLIAAVLSVSMLAAAFPCVSAEAATSSTIASNKKYIYNYLANAGYNNAAICGIMANFEKESDFDTMDAYGSAKTKAGYTDATYTAAVDDGSYTAFTTDSVGYGLAQWTTSEEKTKLYNLAKLNGTSVSDINTQMQLLVSDLSSHKAGTYLRSIDNTADGAYNSGWYFCYYYEVPAARSTSSETRGNLARDTYWPIYGTAEAETSSATLVTTTSYTTGTWQVTASSLNVRSGPDTTYKSLGSVKSGEKYAVTEISNVKWGKITYNGSTGWISLKYCSQVSTSSSSTSSSSTSSGSASSSSASSSSTSSGSASSSSTSSGSASSSASSESASYTITASSLTLRSGRGTSYTALTSIPKGTVVTISDISDNWGKTTYNNKTGYVCMTYCKLTSTSSSSASSSSASSTSTSSTSTSSTSTSSTSTAASTTASSSSASAAADCGTWKVTEASSMNIRSGPGTTYDVIACVSKGYTFTVQEISSNNWGKFTYKGTTAWISLKYCTKQ